MIKMSIIFVNVPSYVVFTATECIVYKMKAFSHARTFKTARKLHFGPQKNCIHSDFGMTLHHRYGILTSRTCLFLLSVPLLVSKCNMLHFLSYGKPLKSLKMHFFYMEAKKSFSYTRTHRPGRTTTTFCHLLHTHKCKLLP